MKKEIANCINSPIFNEKFGSNIASKEICDYIRSNMSGIAFHSYMHMLYDIRSLMGPDDKTYLEIGSFCGFSCSLMLSHPYDTTLYCIDPFKEPTGGARLNRDIREHYQPSYTWDVIGVPQAIYDIDENPDSEIELFFRLRV